MMLEETTEELIVRIDQELAATPHPFERGGQVPWLCALCDWPDGMGQHR